MVVAVGIALIPLPGPGWLIVIAGLAIWAVEFHWARRLLALHPAQRAGLDTVGRQPVLAGARCCSAPLGLVFVAVVVWASLKYSLGIDLVDQAARLPRDTLTPDVRGAGPIRYSHPR